MLFFAAAEMVSNPSIHCQCSIGKRDEQQKNLRIHQQQYLLPVLRKRQSFFRPVSFLTRGAILLLVDAEVLLLFIPFTDTALTRDILTLDGSPAN
jgi:hypothetical protein